MCGIAGLLRWRSRGDRKPVSYVVSEMTKSIRHRGPDDFGVWIEDDKSLGLGHARLSIIDLTSTGHQPMMSVDGRFVVTFNGEIYNYKAIASDLRKELQFRNFRGTSDTECLVEAIRLWGVERAFGRIEGMYAIAVWDRIEKVLTLSRDQFGEKPLYVSSQEGSFAFGSELRALRKVEELAFEVSDIAEEGVIATGYVSGRESIFRNIDRLEPGTMMTVRSESEEGIVVATKRLWTIEELTLSCADEVLEDSRVALEVLGRAIRTVVRDEMVADVPIGVLLSGGIDSTAITAAAVSQSVAPVSTFSIGFEEAGFDESVQAAKVAAHLGTRHYAMTVTARMAQDVIPELPIVFDEPFADPSQIPTLLLARFARSHVKVALSGDGGDEMFGGYTRHLWSPVVWSICSTIPIAGRALLARLLTSLRPKTYENIERVFNALRPGARGERVLDHKVEKMAYALKSTDMLDLYSRLLAVPGESRMPSVLKGAHTPRMAPARQVSEAIMALDCVAYLRNDILTKVDRASMSAGLEVRAPFVHPRMARVAWSMGAGLRFRQGVGKWILRRYVAESVPPSLMDRPKHGFGVPLRSWLRGPLRAWADDLIQSDIVKHVTWGPGVRDAWLQHISGSKNREYYLWNALMLISWRLEYQGR